MANCCKNCRYYNYGFCTINVDLPSPYSTCFRYSPKNNKQYVINSIGENLDDNEVTI